MMRAIERFDIEIKFIYGGIVMVVVFIGGKYSFLVDWCVVLLIVL